MALLSALDRLKYKNVYFDEKGRPGLATTDVSRAAILEDLANAIRNGSLSTPDPAAIAELRGFVTDAKTGRPYAPTKKKKNGIGDDFIFCAALAWFLLLTPKPETKVELAGPRFTNQDDAWAAGRGF